MKIEVFETSPGGLDMKESGDQFALFSLPPSLNTSNTLYETVLLYRSLGLTDAQILGLGGALPASDTYYFKGNGDPFSTIAIQSTGPLQFREITDAQYVDDSGIVVVSVSEIGAFQDGFEEPTLAYVNLADLSGEDYIIGSESHDDTIMGGAKWDKLNGRGGDDKIYGGDGGDWIKGGSGDDFLFGEGGKDELQGGNGKDIIYGDKGDDDLYGDAGNDKLIGGTGDDRLWGNAGKDQIRGGEGDDKISGGSGDDKLIGNAGKDNIIGGDDNDTILGGAGNDLLFGESGDDTLLGEGGKDYLNGEDGDDKLYGGRGNDELEGGKGDDVVSGKKGRDSLKGQAGNDTLYGGAGNDILEAGKGRDLMGGGSGGDTFVFGGSDGKNVVKDFTIGEDIIKITGGAASISDLTMSTVGGRAFIEFGSSSVALDGIIFNLLTEDDFLFG